MLLFIMVFMLEFSPCFFCGETVGGTVCGSVLDVPKVPRRQKIQRSTTPRSPSRLTVRSRKRLLVTHVLRRIETGKRRRENCGEKLAALASPWYPAMYTTDDDTGLFSPTAMAPAVQHLPVKAIMEGPSACFRLLDIDDSHGMKHDEYIGLLYSATDNRLAVEELFL